MTEFKYVGSELDLFAGVRHWKRYWSAEMRQFIGGDVLEVGAGIGSNTRYLDTGKPGRFVCLEPDAQLAGRLEHELRGGARKYEAIRGTLESIPAEEQFDTICYIDVLEHIEDDGAELNRAAAHLRPGGRVIVLSPAHQWLFTPFDAAIGHFRRYNRAMVKAISPRRPPTGILPLSGFGGAGCFGGKSVVSEAIDAYAAAASLLGYVHCAGVARDGSTVSPLCRQDDCGGVAQAGVTRRRSLRIMN